MKTKHIAKKKTTFTAQEDDVLMTLDQKSSNFLLSSLTHLYSTPVLAALREYFSNAVDAHTDAPTEKKIRVDFLNTHKDGQKFLKVQDFGVGMDLEVMTKVYTQYGASTRRKNNKTRGGFGLGSKSGLAVSDYFYATSIQNGHMIEALILKDSEKDCSVVRILSQSETDEHSGTTVLIPINDLQQETLFNQAATELSLYNPDMYLLNDAVNRESVHANSGWLDVADVDFSLGWYKHVNTNERLFQYPEFASFEEKMKLIQRNTAIGIGGVYYPTLPSMSSVARTKEFQQLIEEFYKKTMHADRVILNLPIGSVSLPPHRDSIIDDDMSWGTLIPAMQNFITFLDSYLKLKMESLPLKEAVYYVAAHPHNLLTKDSKGVYSFTHHGEKHVVVNNRKGYNQSDLIFSTNIIPDYRKEDRVETGYAFENSLFLVAGGGHTFAALSETGRFVRVDFNRLNMMSYGEKIRYTEEYPKHKLVRIELEAERYEEAFEEREKLRNLGTFLTKNAKKYVDLQYGEGTKFIILFPQKELPKHYQAVIDEKVTLERMLTVVKANGTPVVREKTVPAHVFVSDRGYAIYHEVQKTDKVFYFGGNQSLRLTQSYNRSVPTTEDVEKLRKICNSKSGGMLGIASKGWKKLVPHGNELVIVDLNKSLAKFKKDIPNAQSLTVHVADMYSTFSENEKQGVHHAYSMFKEWNDPDELYRKMSAIPAENYENSGFKALMKDVRLYAIAAMLIGFNDPHSKEYTAIQKEMESETKLFAGRVLAPVHGLLSGPAFSRVYRKQENVITDKMLVTYANLLIPA